MCIRDRSRSRSRSRSMTRNAFSMHRFMQLQPCGVSSRTIIDGLSAVCGMANLQRKICAYVLNQTGGMAQFYSQLESITAPSQTVCPCCCRFQRFRGLTMMPPCRRDVYYPICTDAWFNGKDYSCLEYHFENNGVSSKAEFDAEALKLSLIHI